jgi:D-alanine-D-alanine ligase
MPSGAPRRIRVAVVAGGRSSEHDVSIASAASVIAALDPDRFAVVPIVISRGGGWQIQAPTPARLTPPPAPAEATSAADALMLVPGASAPITPARAADSLDVDVVLPMLHGPFGEDGTLQGLCEMLNVAYVGAGVLGSALAMDKAVAKAVLRDAGIATADSLVLAARRDHPNDPALTRLVAERLGYPVFVKPARLGSSVGISKVHDPGELAAAVELAFRHDDKVLVEEFVSGREVECGVLGNDAPVASAVGEILPASEWYDYHAKYAAGGARIEIPAAIADDDKERIRDVSLRAFAACDLCGMARIDYFLTPNGALVLSEINTIPGFTETSVYARLFGAVGISYPRLLERLIELALERHQRRGTLVF